MSRIHGNARLFGLEDDLCTTVNNWTVIKSLLMGFRDITFLSSRVCACISIRDGMHCTISRTLDCSARLQGVAVRNGGAGTNYGWACQPRRHRHDGAEGPGSCVGAKLSGWRSRECAICSYSMQSSPFIDRL